MKRKIEMFMATAIILSLIFVNPVSARARDSKKRSSHSSSMEPVNPQASTFLKGSQKSFVEL